MHTDVRVYGVKRKLEQTALGAPGLKNNQGEKIFMIVIRVWSM